MIKQAQHELMNGDNLLLGMNEWMNEWMVIKWLNDIGGSMLLEMNEGICDNLLLEMNEWWMNEW